MKKLIAIVIPVILVFVTATGYGQTNKKTETIKVYGNCDMCKATIEGSLKKKDGVISKKWDQKSLMLTVTYDATKITVKQIAQKVADVGYDNEHATATDAKYNGLHKCCKYERPKKEK